MKQKCLALKDIFAKPSILQAHGRVRKAAKAAKAYEVRQNKNRT